MLMDQMLVHALHDMVVNQPDKLVRRLAAIFTDRRNEINLCGLFNGIPVAVKPKDVKAIASYFKIKNPENFTITNVEIIDARTSYALIRVYYTYVDEDDTKVSDREDIQIRDMFGYTLSNLFEIEYF